MGINAKQSAISRRVDSMASHAEEDEINTWGSGVVAILAPPTALALFSIEHYWRGGDFTLQGSRIQG